MGETFYFAHVLRSEDCRLYSLMSTLKIPVCARKVIPFDIIRASDIFWPPALANSLPFYKCPISRARGSAESYGLIILTVFSSRSILLIDLYLEDRCCSMVSADTCTNPVSWSTSGGKKTGSTTVMICFLKAPSTAVHFQNSAWFCRKFSVPRACSWRSPYYVGSRLCCAVAQTRIMYVPCTPRPSSSAQGVHVGLLWGSTPRTLYSHLSIDVYISVLILSVLRWSLELWASGNPQGLPWCWLLPLPFFISLLLEFTAGLSLGATCLIC